MTPRVVTRTLVGRADLVRVAVALADAGLDGEDRFAAAAIALGYERSQPRPEPAPAQQRPAPTPVGVSSGPESLAAPGSTDLVLTPYWRPHTFVWHGEDVRRDAVATLTRDIDEHAADDAAAIRRMKTLRPPKTPPLSSSGRLLPMLQRALTTELEGRDIDVPALIRCWTRGEHRSRLPRLPRRIWPPSLVILDASPHLIPFWRDQNALLTLLTRAVGDGRVIVRTVEDDDFTDLQRGGSLAGLPVLALTDLGWYGGARLQRAWLRLGRQLRRAGEKIHALVPVPTPRWTPLLTRTWSPMAWERPGGGEHSREEREKRASRLLDLASMARRLEPGLLRALRLLLPRAQADVGTEADAWMHDDIPEKCPGATVLRPARAAQRREVFAEEEPEIRTRVAEVLRAWHWHGSRRPELWHMEALSLAELGRTMSFVNDIGRAERFLADLSLGKSRTGESREMIRRWLDYTRDQELHGIWSSMTQAGKALQLAWWATHERDDPPPDVDPSLAPDEDLERPSGPRRYELRQVGEAIEIMDPGIGAPRGGLIGSLNAGIPTVYTVGHDISPRPVSLASTAQIRVLPASTLELRTDRSTLGLRTLTLPEWASAIGRDPAGLWVEMTINGVGYRMRWIPPGRFLMGSPATEQGRWEDEGPQHEVVVSRGYWLGETPVTQALWQAVMDDNPSYFKDPARPVENVSWDEAQGFIEFLNEQPEPTEDDHDDTRVAEDGEHFRLPTEAEWEYACRAGMSTANYAGDSEAVLDAIAWWSGNSENHTHPVRQKQANAWGLHDMLGNVLEWCMDAWGNYSTDSSVLVDPMTAGRRGVHRVFRGGSWDDDAWRVRATYRYARVPGDRFYDLGVRLARGQGYQDPEGEPPGGR